MPFENHTASGPMGVRLVGPSEHVGETRYSWSKTQSGEQQLFIRIEKDNGVHKEYDCLSPIIRLSFTDTSLLVMSVGACAVEKHVVMSSRPGSFNPYLNKNQGRIPYLEIPLNLLQDRTCEVSYETNHMGDFLFIKCSNLEGNTKGGMVLMINISAIGLLQGLDSITLEGKVRLRGNVIGDLSTNRTGTSPFFLYLHVPDPKHFSGIAERFEKDSYQLVATLLNPDGTYEETPIDNFLMIDMTMSNDRSSTPDIVREQDGVTAARKFFNKIFGQTFGYRD